MYSREASGAVSVAVPSGLNGAALCGGSLRRLGARGPAIRLLIRILVNPGRRFSSEVRRTGGCGILEGSRSRFEQRLRLLGGAWEGALARCRRDGADFQVVRPGGLFRTGMTHLEI